MVEVLHKTQPTDETGLVRLLCVLDCLVKFGFRQVPQQRPQELLFITVSTLPEESTLSQTTPTPFAEFLRYHRISVLFESAHEVTVILVD